MARYIVALTPGASEQAEIEVDEVVDGDTRRIDLGSRGVALVGELDKETASRVASRDDVRYVEEDGEVQAHVADLKRSDASTEAEEVPWGVDRIDADEVDDTGSGVDIAIIDTGIDPTHEDLAENVGDGIAIVECSDDDCTVEWDDDNDHGTHVAGTAAAAANDTGVVGVAPQATVHAVKVLSSTGSGFFSDVAEGIVAAAEKGWEVQNMSLGSSEESNVVKDALEEAASLGVTIVSSAGNAGPCDDCVGYPAAYEEAIAVSATDDSDSMAGFSSTGPEVALAAPGVDVTSTLPDDSYGEGSGTSMSSPHVTGTAALLAAQGHSRTEIRSTLTQSGEDIGHGDNEQGRGLLDAEAAMSEEPSDPPEQPIATFEIVLEKSSPSRGNLEGVVFGGSDGQEALPEATVSISGPIEDSKATNAEGGVVFNDIPIGEYGVSVTKDGYDPGETSIQEDDWEMP